MPRKKKDDPSDPIKQVITTKNDTISAICEANKNFVTEAKLLQIIIIKEFKQVMTNCNSRIDILNS